MSDERKNTPRRDLEGNDRRPERRGRIDVTVERDLREWAHALKSSPADVREAVAAVGDKVENVHEYLGRRKQP
jgi:hypothetical protein